MFATLAALCLTPAAPPEPTWLDRLDPAAIPASERFPWQPPELVGIIGTHRGKHWGGVAGATLSPDGTVIASGGSDRYVRLWSARDLTPLAALRGHTDGVHKLVFSPDGKLLATAADNSVSGGPMDQSVRLWRVAGKDSKLWATLTKHEFRVEALAFAADGKTLATVGHDGQVRVWDLTGNEPTVQTSFFVWRDRQERGWFLFAPFAFSPDGKYLATLSAQGTSVAVWDVPAGKRRAVLTEGSGGVEWVEFRPAGTSLRISHYPKPADPDKPLAGSPVIEEWDLSGDKPARVERRKLGGPEPPSLAAARDGRIVVRTDKGGVDVVRKDEDRDRTIASLAGVRVTPGGLSPDGKLLVGSTGARVRVWEVFAAGVRELAADDSPIQWLQIAAFSPTGDRLYAVTGGRYYGDEVFLTWDLRGPKPVLTRAPRTGPISNARVAFGPDGSAAAVSAEPGGAVYDVPTGGAKSAVPGIPGRPQCERIQALAFSPDGKRLAVAAVAALRGEGGDRVVRRAAVWDVRDKDAVLERTLPDVETTPMSFGFTADGKELVVGYQDGSVRWWDLTADPPREVRQLESHPRDASAVAVSPDGKEFATGSAEVRRGKVGEKGAIVIDPEWAVRADLLRFTPDGELLLVMFNTGRFTAVDRSGKVVIDLRPGREPGDYQSPTAANRGFGLTADGRHVTVPTGNGLVYILRLKK